MIRFTVVWHDEALDQLAAIWLESSDRGAISRAADAIDATLSSDGHVKGSPTGDGLRVLHAPPLRVLFAAIEPDRMIKILLVSS